MVFVLLLREQKVHLENMSLEIMTLLLAIIVVSMVIWHVTV